MTLTIAYPGKTRWIYDRIESLEDIFDRCKINEETGCIEWEGHVSKIGGYGYVYRDGNSKRVHRLSYELANNKSIPSSTFICHKCDNPRCCNPDHLFEGSPKDNTQDMFSKGRSGRSGNYPGSRVLSLEQVRNIQSLYRDTKVEQRPLAEMFGVSQRTINIIVNWKG